MSKKASNPRTFTCSMCGYVGFCRPEEEAEAELKEEFGDVDKSDCDVVCDACWEKVRPGNNWSVFMEWKKIKGKDADMLFGFYKDSPVISDF